MAQSAHETILNHRSIRRFSSEPIPRETLETVVRAAQMAPSSCFYQAYTIIHVTSKDTRALLHRVSGGQNCVNSAAEILVFCADFHRGVSYFEDIDPAVIENTEYYTVAVIDAALAGQNALVAAESLGLGGVMVGGIRSGIAEVAKALELPKLVVPLFALCLGWPDGNPGQKPRLPMAAVLKENVYGTGGDDAAIAAYNHTNEAYYTEREGQPDRWTHRCGASLMTDTRDCVGAFAREQGFLKRD
ncbi:oxygen-insensitive NADPH nitroreductase [Ruminococcaceae bacterium OttesenSCG-928-D13]|nr:oxygen-insensitive NADPH nitroreductase [Ruminococcaceae bacterium OttesenSCG-928-D13]